MPHVIIGDTSSDSVRVWVKGDASSTTCQVTLRSALRREQPRAVQLESDSDYTATVLVGGLDPDTAYLVVATFGPSGTSVRGRVRTHCGTRARLTWWPKACPSSATRTRE